MFRHLNSSQAQVAEIEEVFVLRLMIYVLFAVAMVSFVIAYIYEPWQFIGTVSGIVMLCYSKMGLNIINNVLNLKND